MNKTSIIFAIIFLTVLVSGFVYMNKKQMQITVPTPTPQAQATQTPSPTANIQIKEFIVEGSSFKFMPATIAVKKGDTVRIIFKNTQGFHDFALDEFNIATKQLQSGGEETVEFVADKTGSFEYYCSVGTHRQNGMKGTLVIK